MSKQPIRQQFGDFWPTHTRAFGDFLIEARRGFGGDLDSLLILTVIGGRSMASYRAMGMNYEEFLDGKPSSEQLPRYTNIQSIAEVTGIPRETARRKVRDMIARGWIEDTAHGLVASRTCANELEAVTEATFRYLETMLNCIGGPQTSSQDPARATDREQERT